MVACWWSMVIEHEPFSGSAKYHRQQVCRVMPWCQRSGLLGFGRCPILYYIFRRGPGVSTGNVIMIVYVLVLAFSQFLESV